MKKKEKRLTPYTLTIQEMKTLAAKHNGKCLSESYQNIRTKLRWQCKKGHKFEMVPATIKYQNAWCSICAKNEKIERIKDFKKDYYNIDQNKVREFITSRNGSLISDYQNVTGKLLIICENNHEFYMSLKDLRRGYWCKECKGIAPKEEKIKDIDLMHNLTIQLNLKLPDTQLKHIIYLCKQRISEIKEIEAVEELRNSELEELEELEGIINSCEKAKYIKIIKNKNYTRPFVLNNYQYK